MVNRKQYTHGFVLDKSKLTRIVQVIEARFDETDVDYTSRYDITLKKGREITLRSIDDVLDHDNPVNNPVTELSFQFTEELDDEEERSPKGCRVGFDSESRRNIYAIVSSTTGEWSNRLFAEIEEQIERTFQRNFIVKRVKSSRLFPVFVFLLIALFFSFLFSLAIFDISAIGAQNISEENAQYLLEKSDRVSSESDKIDFVFEYYQRRLQDRMNRRGVLGSLGLHWINLILIGTPVLIIIACVSYMVTKCYPRVVFSWGDMEKHFSKLIQKRRTIWTVIVIALVIGILGNLFIVGVSDLIGT